MYRIEYDYGPDTNGNRSTEEDGRQTTCRVSTDPTSRDTSENPGDTDAYDRARQQHVRGWGEGTGHTTEEEMDVVGRIVRR